MNAYGAFAHYDGIAWQGMFRPAKSANYYPVMSRNKPARYPSKDAAYIAALEAALKSVNGHYRRFGDIAGSHKAAAETVFGKGA
jgi:hypothetical protein